MNVLTDPESLSVVNKKAWRNSSLLFTKHNLFYFLAHNIRADYANFKNNYHTTRFI